MFCKIEIQEGYRSRNKNLSMFLERSLHDLPILFIGKMIWLLKHWFKVTKQKYIQHIFSCFLKYLVFIDLMIILLFFHDFSLFFGNILIFPWLFRNLEQIFRNLGKIYFVFRCFCHEGADVEMAEPPKEESSSPDINYLKCTKTGKVLYKIDQK